MLTSGSDIFGLRNCLLYVFTARIFIPVLIPFFGNDWYISTFAYAPTPSGSRKKKSSVIGFILPSTLHLYFNAAIKESYSDPLLLILVCRFLKTKKSYLSPFVLDTKERISVPSPIGRDGSYEKKTFHSSKLYLMGISSTCWVCMTIY